MMDITKDCPPHNGIKLAEYGIVFCETLLYFQQYFNEKYHGKFVFLFIIKHSHVEFQLMIEGVCSSKCISIDAIDSAQFPDKLLEYNIDDMERQVVEQLKKSGKSVGGDRPIMQF